MFVGQSQVPLFFLMPTPHGKKLWDKEAVPHFFLVAFVKWLVLLGVL
jgi:hypothetical protein